MVTVFQSVLVESAINILD